ncbi:hypothetical protein SAMN04487765_1691 [Tenacibaculum sp. MAR_2010_89]|uniref:ATP-binding protein n=1 Tax=Tenacibaculum sp. MAR_2010_89 TaxID=1250198 RepID=UPI00089B47E0|nr:sensor histidine kinase [Tenacibaculum sp. MAR_2010_89]SEE18667.1 hypothetical protein SAMN04487765_1691 [Tenacibaculum sp. MAR_2010_89]
MKRTVLLLLVSVCFINKIAGQTDSLINELKKQKKDTIKVQRLNKLAWKYRRVDSICRIFAEEARIISDSLKYKKGYSTSLMRLGLLESKKNNYKNAEEYYLLSLNIEEKINNLYGIVRAKVQLAKIYRSQGLYDKGLRYANESIIACNELGNQKLMATIYNTIGSMYSSMNLLGKSIEAYKKGLAIREKLGNDKQTAKSYLDIGILYNLLKKYEKGLECLNKSLKLNKSVSNFSELSKVYNSLGVNYFKRKKIDSAITYYKKSLNLKKKYALSNQESLINNIGVAYEHKKKLHLSIDYYKKSIKLSNSSKNELQLLDSYYNLGRVLRKQKKYKQALIYLERSLFFSKKYKKDIVRLEILITIAETYEQLREFKNASIFNEKHIVLRDSVDNIFKEAQMIDSRYEDEIKKNELLKKDKEIAQERILRVLEQNEKKNTLLISLIVGIILLTILFFLSFKIYKTKKAKELSDKNRKLEVQKNIELIKKQELKSIKAMINGQENERNRIAQDLHDRLGSMLSMVKLHYNSIEGSLDKLKEENRMHYNKANSLLDEACVAVREISHDMISGVLTKFGLIAALEDLQKTLEGTSTLQIEFLNYGFDNRLDNSLEMELYSIVQEIIHNIIKHAEAEEVSVQLIKNKEFINLMVIDNGVGFDPTKIGESNGIGIKGIQSRVDSLNGELLIDSGKGNGTTITINIPVS